MEIFLENFYMKRKKVLPWKYKLFIFFINRVSKLFPNSLLTNALKICRRNIYLYIYIYMCVYIICNPLPWLPRSKHQCGKEQWRESSCGLHLPEVVPTPLLQSLKAFRPPMPPRLTLKTHTQFSQLISKQHQNFKNEVRDIIWLFLKVLVTELIFFFLNKKWKNSNRKCERHRLLIAETRN